MKKYVFGLGTAQVIVNSFSILVIVHCKLHFTMLECMKR